MQPAIDEKALVLDDWLVVADLHLGLEKELAMAGARVPSQMERIERRINRLLSDTRKKKLAILGDLKHNIPMASWQEQKEIPEFVERLSSKAEVVLVKGNHDGGIESLAPGLRVVKELWVGETLLIHGHTKTKDTGYRVLIMAHNHPCIEFRGNLGGRLTESAWIRTRFKGERHGESDPEIVIMPAFNDLIYGMPFNTRRSRELLGPFFKCGLVELEGARVYLLDGTYLGRIRDLKETPQQESPQGEGHAKFQQSLSSGRMGNGRPEKPWDGH